MCTSMQASLPMGLLPAGMFISMCADVRMGLVVRLPAMVLVTVLGMALVTDSVMVWAQVWVQL